MRNFLLLTIIIICLISCSKDESIQPKPIATACFSYSPDDYIIIDDTITFSNCSENATDFFWDFGDGIKTSEKDPQHIFQDVGYFNIG